MQTRLSLRYSGPAVEAGLMDVYDATANMIAFSEFVVAAAKATYGEEARARAEVAGFGRGSFVTDLVINVSGPIATLLTAGTMKELFRTINEAVKLWKHLGGVPPQKSERGQNNTINVTNNNGQILTVNTQSVSLVFQEKASEAAQRFIHDALGKQGMDSVSVDAEHEQGVERIIEVSQREASAFVPVAPEVPLFDNTIKTALIIEAPVFKDGNKWRFSDGSSSFHADIADADFISRVNNGEAFAKGDSLIVEMRIQQNRQGERLVTEKTILKVIEHRSRPMQGGLL